MKTFFGSTQGLEFVEFGIVHFILLFLIVFGSFMIYKFKNQIRTFKYEKQLRYTLASVAILWEVALYIWVSVNIGWDWAHDLPILSLCGLALIIAIIAMFKKNYFLFEIGYFWAIGGLISVLFPDITYSLDRFRFYQFMFGHMLFFYMYMYLLFVHDFIPTFKSYKKSAAILFVYCMVMLIPNALWGTNALFLKESDGTPFEVFEGGPYIVYLVLVVVSAAVVLYLWYLLVRLYEKKVYVNLNK